MLLFSETYTNSTVRPYAGQIDIITGGFPCQPYSQAGKRKGNDDDRALWPEMLRVIREVAPDWVVGENVAGILSMDGGRVFAGILADLENAGYSAETYLIPAVGVGAPHERCRVWIVAHRDTGNGTVPIQPQGGRYKIENAYTAGQNSGPTTDDSGIGRQRRADNERPQPPCGKRIGFDDSRANADTDVQRCQQLQFAAKPGFAAFDSGQVAADIADAPRIGEREQDNEAHPIGGGGQTRKGIGRGDWAEHWYEVATRICGVDDGLPAGVDGTGRVPAKAQKGKAHRLEGLGNAVVPHIPFQIFTAINEYHANAM